MPTDPRFELFAACSPGTENVCRDELRALAMGDVQTTRGGAIFHGTLDDAARANLWLRTASRVLLRLGAFDAPGRRELLARARRLSLDGFVPPGSGIRLHVSATRSRLYHTGLITEVFHEATGTLSANEDAVVPELFVRLERDRCTVSIDTSGELLHRRGYRQDVSRAPLRETLAAAMLLLCGYDGRDALVDPMCGSGTIPIEAYLIATGRAPGQDRAFALERFPCHVPAALSTSRSDAMGRVRPLTAPIHGSDVHAGALAAARANALRARAEEIRWGRCDVEQASPPAEHGLLLTNPPYGKRVGHGQESPADASLRGLSSALEGAFRHWRAGVLVPAGVGASPARRHRLDNGGIAVDLVEMEQEG